MADNSSVLSMDFLKASYPMNSVGTDFGAEIEPHVEGLISKLEELSALEDGWLGYNSVPPTTPAFLGAVFFITRMIRPNTPFPDIFPSPNGNIQLEWSCFDLDIEIEIESHTKYLVSFEDLNSDTSWDKMYSYDLTEIKELHKEIFYFR